MVFRLSLRFLTILMKQNHLNFQSGVLEKPRSSSGPSNLAGLLSGYSCIMMDISKHAYGNCQV